jgi:hypothetical protein
MFRNPLITGIRNFRKNKSYSFLNILGLAIGIACAGLIFLWVEDETEFDQVHVKKERLYMVLNNCFPSSISNRLVCDAFLAAELCLLYYHPLVDLRSCGRRIYGDRPYNDQLSDDPGGHRKSDPESALGINDNPFSLRISPVHNEQPASGRGKRHP